MSQVLCFGELLLRYSPRLQQQWITENQMSVFVGGAELNVALGLQHLGYEAAYCSAIPDHYLSQEILQWLQSKSLDTSRVLLRGSRIGTYYLPQGTDLKGEGVIYDRAYSSFWDLFPGEIDWDSVLQNVHWLHFTAISPALNQNLADVCLEAAKAAVAKGIRVSVDLNYRSRLWQYGKKAVEIMPGLVQYCEVVMGNIWSAEAMLGIELPDFKPSRGGYLEAAGKCSAKIVEQYPRCRFVANTFRFSGEERLEYYAGLYSDGQLYTSQLRSTDKVIDRIGTGDSFMAGLIYGLEKKMDMQQLIDFAAAVAFNKLFIRGDASTATAEDIFSNYSIGAI